MNIWSLNYVTLTRGNKPITKEVTLGNNYEFCCEYIQLQANSGTHATHQQHPHVKIILIETVFIIIYYRSMEKVP
jgi:hypothetical protein